MSFVDLSVVILASMVAILAGMVGYMYWQQSRILQVVSSLSVFVTSQFIKQPDLDLEEDDRESVEESPKEVETSETTETKESPVEVVEDVDDLQGKTSSELKELLSKKGIPYGKRDSKSVLLQLLKAAS
jgi:flagellar basal body-associated protein FliL